MTVKLLGALLLTGAGFLLGRGPADALRRRMELLRSLDASLGLMADELTVLRTPLPRVFEKLSDRPFFALLWAGFGSEPMEALWRRAAETLELDGEDRRTLAALAPVVGRYDADRQAEELSLVRRRLERSAEAAEQELRGRARCWAGLGACCGAMLAVILF